MYIVLIFIYLFFIFFYYRKYEKSKEMTCQLKGNEENLIAESRKNAENLRLQEQRYDKMKNHAMQQLEM